MREACWDAKMINHFYPGGIAGAGGPGHGHGTGGAGGVGEGPNLSQHHHSQNTTVNNFYGWSAMVEASQLCDP
jgi:hypothetical protein